MGKGNRAQFFTAFPSLAASLCFMAALVFRADIAATCVSGGLEGAMPVCARPTLDPKNRAIAIVGEASLPTNLLFSSEGRDISANLIDIEINGTDMPLHFILSNDRPAIFRFTGRTDAIARVTTLGSLLGGPDYVGVIGVDRERIARVPVIGRDPARVTTCRSPPRSCVLESLFDVRDSRTYPVSSNWPPYESRPVIEEAIRIGGTRRVVIDRSAVSREQRVAAEKQFDFDAWRKRRGTLTPLAAYLEDYGPAIILDPATVRAPIQVVVAATLPSWEGFAGFERRGLLHSPGTATFDHVYGSWAAHFTASYRSRVDPTYAGNPVVDAVVTGQIRIPHDLLPQGDKPSVALLIARGAPVPEMGRFPGACLFFDDARTHEQACNRLSAPDLPTRKLLADDERRGALRKR